MTWPCASALCDPVVAPCPGTDTPWLDLFDLDAQADSAKLAALEAEYVRLKRFCLLRSLARLNVTEYRGKVALLVTFRGWRVAAHASGSKPKRSRGKRGKKHFGKR